MQALAVRISVYIIGIWLKTDWYITKVQFSTVVNAQICMKAVFIEEMTTISFTSTTLNVNKHM